MGGFVISENTLASLVPVENASMADRTVIQWDKDDLETLGLLKVDCLALGMLTAIHRCLDLVNNFHNTDMGLADVPAEDPATYGMIQQGRYHRCLPDRITCTDGHAATPETCLLL